MRILPRDWYFYYGRKRLYRRLIACANGLGLVAGLFGVFYLSSAERTEAVYSRGAAAPDLVSDATHLPAKAATEARTPETRPNRGTDAARLPAKAATEAVVYFPNCSAARAAGKAPILRGEPGYSSHLDRDNDGIACEPYRRIK